MTTRQWRWTTQFLEKYTSHFIWKGCVCERELKTEQNWNILTPTLMAISVVSFSFFTAARPEGRRPTLLSAGILYHILSPTGLQTDWLPVFTEFYNSSIVHSISLKWHVWLSSSGNKCHAIHRSFSSGASVYDCSMGFYLVPFCQSSPPTRFLPITAIRMSHFFLVHHFGMACLAGSKVNIQHLHLVCYCHQKLLC